MELEKKSKRGIKVQITIPIDLYEAIEADMRRKFLRSSVWFTQATRAYLERSSSNRPKKTINLDD